MSDWKSQSSVFSDDAIVGLIDAKAAIAGAFAAIAAVFFFLINEPGEKQQTASASPGNVIVELFWPQEHDADVDLWVVGPGGTPVGFSNLVGEHFNLLRDDLGHTVEEDMVNYETAMTRGIPSGAYCVNVHLYSNDAGVLPMPVEVSVRIAKEKPGSRDTTAKGGSRPVLSKRAKLLAQGHELNIWCFFLDEMGDIVAGSVYTSQSVRLRSPQKF